MRHSANAGNARPGVGMNSWGRPLPAKLAGLAMLIGAPALTLGGAYREQSNLITAGLMFLFLGMVLAPGVIRKSLVMRIAAIALALLGLFYALTG